MRGVLDAFFTLTDLTAITRWLGGLAAGVLF
jgi:hypothetical protein